MDDMILYCFNWQGINRIVIRKLKDNYSNGDDVIRTVSGEPDFSRRKDANLQRKMEFTMKRTDESGYLAFLDKKINVYSCKGMN